MPKLIPGSSHTLTIDPELASWIGLNEAIFIQQLDYVLSNKEEDQRYMKTIGEQRWYRESPRDFVVHHFQFWDENVVKRTLANLRKDGLVLARSDLNKDPKDRSLWYSINYSALERLSGPVDRLLEKQEKRRKARQVRTENEAKQEGDSDSDYTKVQNVLLTSEVQNVENSESTKCTPTKVQNVPLTQVQNVLTPKEVIPKEVIKDSADNPPKPRTKKQKLFVAIVSLCHIDFETASDPQLNQVKNATNALLKRVDDPQDFERDFKTYWYSCDWRGKKDQCPIPSQVRDVFGDFQHWLKNGQQKGQRNNGQKQPGCNQETNPDGPARKPPADNTDDIRREIARLEQGIKGQTTPAT